MNVEIETDCQQALNLIQGKTSFRGTAGLICHGILRSARTFNGCKWSFVRRSGNNAAHYLASLRPSSFLSILSIDELPDPLLDIVIEDLKLLANS